MRIRSWCHATPMKSPRGTVTGLFVLGTVLAGLSALPAPARAESLRCNGQSAEVGDSRVSLLYKCGEPLLRDSFCAPVFVGGPQPPGVLPQPLSAPLAQAVVGCVPVDEWLYDRGPGHLMATVRLQSGVIQSIRYARSPR
jgi:hypothetical protein